MASLTLKDVGVALGGLLGPKADAYAAGVGAATGGVALKVSSSLRDFLYKQGQKLGNSLGSAGAFLPGVVAAGAAQTGAATQDAFEAKFLGLSLTKTVILAAIVTGGLVLWLLRSRK